MPRPFMQHGVGQLEELFAKSKADTKVLKHLEHELQYRQVPRAVALLAEVQAVMYGSTPVAAPSPAPKAPAPTPVAVPPPQIGFWDAQPPPAIRATAPAPTVAPAPVIARANPAPSPTRAAPAPAPAMPLEDAYKLLKATPGSTWESIEQTRRLLVMASHPEKLKALAEGKRAQALAEASRINSAYAALSQARCAGR